MGSSVANTKKQILKMLYGQHDRFLSGQKICETLGCSRTAVWKHIKELENEGFVIEAAQKKGYRLLSSPKGLNEARLSIGLETERLGRRLYFYESIGSTQKEALRLADEGAEDGTVVITNEQVSGRGRLGHSWHSAKGDNIAMSLILRPDLPIQKTPQLTLLTAVAVAKTIEELTGLSCGIKWPNDILYHGKKCVGILTELQAEATYVKSVIIGIGINVNTDPSAFPNDIDSRATSLKAITGKEYDLVRFVQLLLKTFEKIYRLYLKEGFSVVKLMWESRAVSLGKRIRVRRAGGRMLEGYARGIDDEGVLLLEDSSGQVHRIYSADIELS